MLNVLHIETYNRFKLYLIKINIYGVF
jgi:hypothetical protein